MKCAGGDSAGADVSWYHCVSPIFHPAESTRFSEDLLFNFDSCFALASDVSNLYTYLMLAVQPSTPASEVSYTLRRPPVPFWRSYARIRNVRSIHPPFNFDSSPSFVSEVSNSYTRENPGWNLTVPFHLRPKLSDLYTRETPVKIWQLAGGDCITIQWWAIETFGS